MTHALVLIEQEAIRLKNSGRTAEAIELFKRIVEERADWEHGSALHNLGQCYEDIGDTRNAKVSYLAALQYEPENPYYIGAYASFLFLHGERQEALKYYLSLLKINERCGDEIGYKRVRDTVKMVAQSLGYSAKEIDEKIVSG